jgi:precorrin-2 dehydrogenase / sirohydrochlorin ferrochelatase
MKQSVKIPFYFDLQGRIVLIVGGGNAAAEKLRGLQGSGCTIRLCAPVISDEVRTLLAEFALSGGCEVHQRVFVDEDILGSRLVFAATDCSETNQTVYTLAEQQNIWASIVDNPTQTSFYSCSQFRHGPWIFAISTDGKFAGLSKFLRMILEHLFLNQICKC